MKNIFKFILLWTTMLCGATLLCGIDSIIEKGIFIVAAWAAIFLLLFYMCQIFISKREFLTLSGIRFLKEVTTPKK